VIRNTILKLYVPVNIVKPSGHCKLTAIVGLPSPYSYNVVTVVTMNTVRASKAIMSSASHLQCTAHHPPGHLAGQPTVITILHGSSILLLVANGHHSCIKCTRVDVRLRTPDDGQRGCPKNVES